MIIAKMHIVYTGIISLGILLVFSVFYSLNNSPKRHGLHVSEGFISLSTNTSYNKNYYGFSHTDDPNESPIYVNFRYIKSISYLSPDSKINIFIDGDVVNNLLSMNTISMSANNESNIEFNLTGADAGESWCAKIIVSDYSITRWTWHGEFPEKKIKKIWIRQ